MLWNADTLPVVIWPVAVLSALFMLLWSAESVWPFVRRDWTRWPVNLGLGALTLVLGRLLSFVGPLAAALAAEKAGFGLLHQASVPFALALPFSIVAMDLALWAQHLAFHRSAWLWRWHSLHHADPMLDISTAVRFHPVEAVVSLLWKSLVVALLGVPPFAVPLFELWLTGGSLIEHANLRVPARADTLIRAIWVTPAMHRVHHSAHGDDAQHNFGFALSIWDRIFGTMRELPGGPAIGLPGKAWNPGEGTSG